MSEKLTRGYAAGAARREKNPPSPAAAGVCAELISDLLEGTERAMTRDHIFKAAEFSLLAQKMAEERR